MEHIIVSACSTRIFTRAIQTSSYAMHYNLFSILRSTQMRTDNPQQKTLFHAQALASRWFLEDSKLCIPSILSNFCMLSVIHICRFTAESALFSLPSVSCAAPPYGPRTVQTEHCGNKTPHPHPKFPNAHIADGVRDGAQLSGRSRFSVL
jgi:hypothetical protein